MVLPKNLVQLMSQMLIVFPLVIENCRGHDMMAIKMERQLYLYTFFSF